VLLSLGIVVRPIMPLGTVLVIAAACSWLGGRIGMF
jgi:hypothetical protein